MKFRNGFVSNSSSSSFIAFVEKSDFDKAFNKLNEEEKRILGYFEPEIYNFKNKQFVKLNKENDEGDLSINEKYVDDDELKDLFPDEYNNMHYRYDYQDQIEVAFTTLIDNIDKNKILSHSSYH